MNLVQKLAIAYVLIVLAIIYGYAVGRFQVFPYDTVESLVQNYQDFAEGDSMERKTSVATKIKSDLGGDPGRWTYHYPALADANSSPRSIEALDNRSDAPRVYVADEHREGYRVIIGALQLRNTFWGGLLLNPDGDIIHSWDLSSSHLKSTARNDLLKNLYGVHVYPDGSVIFVMQERGGGIVKVDACSNIVWSLPGLFHHVVSPDEHGNIWSFTGKQSTLDQDMVKISAETGKILETIKMVDIRRANPDIYVWDLYKFSFADRAELYATGNMTHGNDIEPLPTHLAEDFPNYSPGDLLISYATNNLVLVLDPNTLKIKWWRIGISDLQHDPDWEPDGKVSILSNNPRSGKFNSDIVTVDLDQMKHEVSLAGDSVGFLTIINGRHQLTPWNTRLVTSAQQGWVFEVDEHGEVVFSFVNNINHEEKKSLHVSEAWRLKEDYFDNSFWNTCD
jgi:hypothetical protein